MLYTMHNHHHVLSTVDKPEYEGSENDVNVKHQPKRMKNEDMYTKLGFMRWRRSGQRTYAHAVG